MWTSSFQMSKALEAMQLDKEKILINDYSDIPTFKAPWHEVTVMIHPAE